MKAQSLHGHLLLSPVVISVLVASLSTVSTASDQCNSVTQSSDSGGSCTFRFDWCGWSNTDDDQLQWTDSGGGENSHLSIKMAGVGRGKKGALISPLLCATGSGLRSFRFRYYLYETTRCRLSLYIVTGGTLAVRVWHSTSGDSYRFQSVDTVTLKCPDQPFRIMFVGEKLSGRSCGYYNEIDLQDIVYDITNPLFQSDRGECAPAPSTTPNTTTTTTTITTTTTTMTTTSTTATKTTPARTTTVREAITKDVSTTNSSLDFSGRIDGDEETGGISSGAIAGIVVAIVFIIIVIVAIAICVILRRQKKWTWKWKGSLPTAAKIRRSVTHRTHYMLGAQPNEPALPNLERHPQPSAPPLPHPAPPTHADTSPPPSAPTPTDHHPHRLPTAAILPKKGRQSPPQAEGEVRGGVDSGREADGAVDYMNCGAQPTAVSEHQYNVLHEGSRGNDRLQPSETKGAARSNAYDHLHDAGNTSADHSGERNENRRQDGELSTTTTTGINHSPTERVAAATRPDRRDDAGNSSDDAVVRGDGDIYANECKYANGYANRDDGDDEYSVAARARSEGLDGEDTYYNLPVKEEGRGEGGGGGPVTESVYSLAQHQQDLHQEERGDDDTCLSTTTRPRNTTSQYSLAQNFKPSSDKTSTKPPVLPKTKTKTQPPGEYYSLAQQQNAAPHLNDITTQNHHVTRGDVSGEYAHVWGQKKAGEIPNGGKNGDYANMPDTSSNAKPSPPGASNKGRESYNRLDFNERPDRQEEDCDPSRAAGYQNAAAVERDRYDHLQLSSSSSPLESGAGEELYYNVGSDSGSPC